MKIATTDEATVWQCDRCEMVAKSPNAFTLPPGWWVAHIERRTPGGRLKRGSIDACSKVCLTEAITFENQYLIPDA